MYPQCSRVPHTPCVLISNHWFIFPSSLHSLVEQYFWNHSVTAYAPLGQSWRPFSSCQIDLNVPSLSLSLSLFFSSAFDVVPISRPSKLVYRFYHLIVNPYTQFYLQQHCKGNPRSGNSSSVSNQLSHGKTRRKSWTSRLHRSAERPT